MNHEAIYALYPNVVTISDETGAFDENGNSVQIDMTLVESWVNPQEYKQNRVKEYPPISEQLDDLFKAGRFSKEMTARIKQIKDKYPKGNA